MTTDDETRSRTARDLVRVSEARSTDRTVSVLLAATLFGLALAVLKPWAWGSAPSSSIPFDRSAAAAAPSPSPSSEFAAGLASTVPASLAPDQACYPAQAWRLYTVEDDGRQRVLTWYSLAPLTAEDVGPEGGPLDPAIPVVHVFAQQLRALGFCAPYAGQSSAALETAVWRLTGRGSGVTPVGLRAAIEDEPGPGHGHLFVPPAEGASQAAWPAGRYVFAVSLDPSRSKQAWFTVEVDPVNLPGQATAPVATPP